MEILASTKVNKGSKRSQFSSARIEVNLRHRHFKYHEIKQLETNDKSDEERGSESERGAGAFSGIKNRFHPDSNV